MVLWTNETFVPYKMTYVPIFANNIPSRDFRFNNSFFWKSDTYTKYHKQIYYSEQVPKK